MKKLILLPCLDGTGLLFQPLLEQLGDCPTQVITYPTHTNLSLEQLTQHVMQQAVFDQNTVLLAESFSGLVALALLREGIELHSIIFCASFASAPRPYLLKLANYLPLEILFKLPLPALALKTFLKPPLIKIIQQVHQRVSPAVLAYRLRLIANARMELEQTPWAIPCYYLQAANDWAVPTRCINELKQYFIRFEVITINDSGHFLLQTQPKLCAKHIRNICV